MNVIDIKENSGVPKYKQILGAIEKSIENGAVKKGDRLPSINSIRNKFDLSRDTVLLAFNELKIKGIVQSVAGKGYFVKNDSVGGLKRVFLLFDELNNFKEDLYNAFLAHLGKDIQVDIYFHHFNHELFDRLVDASVGEYSAYVIMPANLRNIELSLSKLPAEQVFILDQTHAGLAKYPAIFQNFKKDIFNTLSSAYGQIKKYDNISLVYDPSKQPQGMALGFEAFCKTHRMKNEVLFTIPERKLVPGELFLVPGDRDLIALIKKIRNQHLKIGKHIGIISYNDTPLKEIVAEGITTISTDFKGMGVKLAQMILGQEKKHIENDCSIILRNSL
jgi:DNA-binding transcriptional regulator YhcF (GntR family)